jgi:hypothetical protein
VNVCYCDQVPCNQGEAIAAGRRVIYIVCGSLGKTTDGYAVYDVALSPLEAAQGVELKEEVKIEICQQALLCISALTSEGDFFSFQWESGLCYKERALDGKLAASASGPVLAVPAPAALKELWQCSTRLEDASAVLDEASGDESEHDAAAILHRERLQCKLVADESSVLQVCRTVTAETACPTRSLRITPHAGFVIKTHKSSDQLKKVFVNVYHHEEVDGFVREQFLALGGGAEEELCVLIGEPGDVSDKEGVISRLYHVVVASKFFLASYVHSAHKITDAVYVRKVLAALNARFNDDLDSDSFVLPRIKGGFKGDWAADMMAFSYSTSPPRTRLSVSGESAAPQSSLSLHSIFPAVQAKSGSAAHDSDSIVSDITTATDATGFSMARKPFLELFYPQKQRPLVRMLGSSRQSVVSVQSNVPRSLASGCDLINADMLAFNRSLNLDLQGALQLKQLAVSDPLVLTGWQVTLFDKNNKSGTVAHSSHRC